MELLIFFTILFYIPSTAGYVFYLFLQQDRLYRAGYYLLIAGFLCHSAAAGYGTVLSGHIPVHNLRGTLLIAGWAVAGVFLIFQYKYNLKTLGIYAAPLVTLVVITASLLPDVPLQAQNIFNSFWLIIHIIAVFVGEASLALACGAGLLYLVQEHTIKIKIRGFFFKRLPSLELLDNTGYAFIIIGFSMLTLGLITGLVYAKSVWGRFWSWDPKEIWSVVTWLIYAALLHGRLSTGWRGRRAAIMSIIGFAALLFTFLGVNFLLTGHHGEFTKF
jgi:cytochrome c-type biogenesis protein CcsB